MQKCVLILLSPTLLILLELWFSSLLIVLRIPTFYKRLSSSTELLGVNLLLLKVVGTILISFLYSFFLEQAINVERLMIGLNCASLD